MDHIIFVSLFWAHSKISELFNEADFRCAVHEIMTRPKNGSNSDFPVVQNLRDQFESLTELFQFFEACARKALNKCPLEFISTQFYWIIFYPWNNYCRWLYSEIDKNLAANPVKNLEEIPIKNLEEMPVKSSKKDPGKKPEEDSDTKSDKNPTKNPSNTNQTTLFVSGIPKGYQLWHHTSKDYIKHFLWEKIPNAADIHVPIDRKGITKGIALVRLSSGANVKDVLSQVKGLQMGGQTLKINKSKPKDSGRPSGGSGFRGGNSGGGFGGGKSSGGGCRGSNSGSGFRCGDSGVGLDGVKHRVAQKNINVEFW